MYVYIFFYIKNIKFYVKTYLLKFTVYKFFGLWSVKFYKVMS